MLFVFAAARLLQYHTSNLAFSLSAALAASFSTLAIASDLVDLKPATIGGSHRQVRMLVDSNGKLKLNADGQEVKHLPLKVEGELLYAERVLARGKTWLDTRVARHYQKASAKIRLHESDLTTDLRLERRLIAVESSAAQSLTFSPSGPLTREELELLEPPAGSLAPEALLPPRALKAGGRYPLEEAVITRLLGLEAVTQHDVSAALESAKDGVALITFAGKVTGAVGGVSSDSELKGKLNFDLKKRAVTWLTIAVKENRAIGHAKPGFEVVTTIRMVAEPVNPAPLLDDKSLAGLTLKPGPGEKLLEMTSAAAGFQLHHDRRWSVMLDRPDLAVLRFVDRGDLIAQCNITPRPALAEGQQLTMEGFQNDVKRVLGSNFEEIVEATEETDDLGRRLLRVVVAGKVGDLPIQWTYYELADNKNGRASLVFTLEASLLDRFASLDRELLAGFSFIATKQPTPAAEPKAAARQQDPGSQLR
jgi:hypothetical protein